ncbi:MAG: hypothetical protein RLZZ303_2149 [Candidatus Hydrogenedentota bacterium]
MIFDRLMAGLMAAGLSLGAAADSDGMAFYEAKVAPIFQEHCAKCHGDGRVRAGLNLMWRTGLLEGGDKGPAIDLAAPEQSLLLDMLSYRDEDHEMPPEGKLPDEQIAVIREWVMLGAPMPDVKPEGVAEEEHASPYKTEVNDETRNWWSYRRVTPPMVPVVADAAWNAHPIDAFIFDRLAIAGLSPAPEASRQTLIRRATYDLTGLPPTPAEVDAFVTDPDPLAYEKLIDRLLASPHYGEKWGRHWLDVVRYAETNGYERDNPKPHIWRYRDYVINAFNSDKPYDRFLMEQLAGDELPGAGAEGITATGYYRLGLWDDEPVDKLQGRYDVLDNVVATTTEAMLATTMGCARCHDHKIDPMPQKDYYRFLSFFDNVTDMHTTDITRSILEGEEAAQFAEAIDAKNARIARQDRRVRDLEDTFLAALRERHPDTGIAAQTSDMSGMRYRFYRDTWDTLPEFDTLRHENEGTLNENFFDLGERTRNEAFGFVFEATLHVPEDAEYVFHLDANDGARLIIDGEWVINYDGVNNLGREQETRKTLAAGSHPVRLEYFQRVGEMGLKVAWSGPGFERRSLSTPKATFDFPREIAERGDELVAPGFAADYVAARKRAETLRKREVRGGKYAAAVRESGTEPRQTFVHFRGNPNVPGDAVSPGFPEVLGFPDPGPATPPPSGDSTGLRTQLAAWIASPENPLTARVMVNRIWQHHFGRGIVRSSSDFGQAGNLPTHPELLDWLAVEFVGSGWSMKHMHRAIMLSRVYRISSHVNAESYARDPANDLFWRFDMRRLTAEEIRDSILAVNGSINLQLGGESVFPPLPRAVLETSSTPDTAWKSSPPEQHTRRSIYIHVKRSLLTPLLTDFDLADTDTSCPVRFATTQPLQALNMLNSEFVNQQAEVFAARLKREAQDEHGRVRLALNLATGRPPADDELNQALGFMDEMKNGFGLNEDAALNRLALLMLNLNEFVYLD